MKKVDVPYYVLEEGDGVYHNRNYILKGNEPYRVKTGENGLPQHKDGSPVRVYGGAYIKRHEGYVYEVLGYIYDEAVPYKQLLRLKPLTYGMLLRAYLSSKHA